MAQEITAKDIKGLMLRNYRRYSNGEISESKAYRENAMLANILKLVKNVVKVALLSAIVLPLAYID